MRPPYPSIHRTRLRGPIAGYAWSPRWVVLRLGVPPRLLTIQTLRPKRFPWHAARAGFWKHFSSAHVTNPAFAEGAGGAVQPAHMGALLFLGEKSAFRVLLPKRAFMIVPL